MRGEAGEPAFPTLRLRITPACAGRSAARARRFRRLTDHPRVCGEKRSGIQAVAGNDGSPPRVRGEVVRHDVGIPERRITPACAGRRSGRRCTTRRSRDHPRVCGEKLQMAYGEPPVYGSPPRVRGEVVQDRVRVRDKRITPACAGRSRTYACRSRGVRDHPRVCGEKSKTTSPGLEYRGSPPRVRGEAVAARVAMAKERITPACAGRRDFLRSWTPDRRDHPRVCGEK